MKSVLAFALVLLFTIPAFALSEAPTGFADIAWGTTKDEAKRLLTKKCRSLKESGEDVRCPGYELEGLGKVDVTLSFVDQELRGYSVSVPMGSRQPDLLGAAMGKFGSPAIYPKTGASSPVTWAWPGGISVYMEMAAIKKATLGVSQKSLTDAKQKEWTAERDRLKKGL